MTRFITLTETHDKYFDIFFQSESIKPSLDYVHESEERLKLRIELVRDGKKLQVMTIAELIDAIEKLGIAPQEYATSEPITLARAVSFVEDKGRAIYSHPLFEEILAQYSLSLTDYMPKWESPFLVWYVFDSSDRLHPIRERTMNFI
jgi:hypothetical protein